MRARHGREACNRIASSHDACSRRTHLSPFTKDDRGQVSQWLQYFWRAFAQTFHAMRMQTPYAGVHWLQSVKRQWRCISSKTVLYTGSVFEYIRAWRFQPLAQGQSRMTKPALLTPMSKAMIGQTRCGWGSQLLSNLLTQTYPSGYGARLLSECALHAQVRTLPSALLRTEFRLEFSGQTSAAGV